jgi:1-deoxy-D-xylulose 5-phosphate reductoisomerase
MQVMCELLSHKRALRRPAVVAAVSNETPALIGAIYAAATSAAAKALEKSSQQRVSYKSRDVEKAAGGGEVEHLATALTRVKQAALRVETAEKAVAVFASSRAYQTVADVIEGIQGLRTQLKELQQVRSIFHSNNFSSVLCPVSDRCSRMSGHPMPLCSSHQRRWSQDYTGLLSASSWSTCELPLF